MRVRADKQKYQNRSPERVDLGAAVAAAIAELDKQIPLDALPPVAKSDQVAAVLQTTSPALATERYLQIHGGKPGIPFVKLGARVRYFRTDVLHFLATNRVGGEQLALFDLPTSGDEATACTTPTSSASSRSSRSTRR